MRDPLVHVERTPVPGFTHARMRELITAATGLTGDLPKTVGTGCGRRRPIAATSIVPEHVTCLACREYAHAQHLREAENAEALLAWDDADMCQALAMARTTRPELAELAREHRARAARFEVTP